MGVNVKSEHQRQQLQRRNSRSARALQRDSYGSITLRRREEKAKEKAEKRRRSQKKWRVVEMSEIDHYDPLVPVKIKLESVPEGPPSTEFWHPRKWKEYQIQLDPEDPADRAVLDAVRSADIDILLRHAVMKVGERLDRVSRPEVIENRRALRAERDRKLSEKWEARRRAEQAQRAEQERLRRLEQEKRERARAEAELTYRNEEKQLVDYDTWWATPLNGALGFDDIPWPIFGERFLERLTMENVCAFILHPARIAITKSGSSLLEKELLLWHPDRFVSSVLSRVREGEREHVLFVMNLVFKALTTLKEST
ncbi:hypothetical protein PUNSTDRAFT_143717 [Punctularia strigosozonata HHB-11173 SS5]|uniref:uncharacterized protein n=1 Tax=Punctularia strigosozonata (strain HHB-11173) TaxID=741275 RepID=UPI000441666B|nr:uncharacterized protein PUNSTDRAFT_143717 [Punctularia strigosozonata HHB-11173 SS5]EIN09128.1 hypothetical protein PUNSTDRAFT_143717 [Punctularia strigosozonata HHB-11173 SS5]